MNIEFECHCGEILQVSKEYAGRRGRCPSCQQMVKVPEIQAGEKGESRCEMGEPEEPLEPPPAEGPGDFYTNAPYEDQGWAERSSFFQGEGIIASVKKWVLPAGLGLLLLITIGVLLRGGDGEEADLEEHRIEQAEEMSPETGETLATGPRNDTAVPLPEVGGEESGFPPRDVTASRETATEPDLDVPSPPVQHALRGEPKVAVKSTEIRSEEPKEVLPERPTSRASYTINLATFKESSRAERYVKELKKKGITAFVWEVEIPEHGPMHRVSTGHFMTREKAETASEELQRSKKVKTFVVKIPQGKD